MTLEVCFAEFGPKAVEPDLKHFREVWPDATFYVSHEGNTPAVPELQPDSPYYHIRRHNYFQAVRMLESPADVVIALDCDMRAVDIEAARLLPDLAKRFGICAPANPRRILRVDIAKGADSDRVQVPFAGIGMPVNCSPIAFARKARVDGAHLLTVLRMKEHLLANPNRGTVSWVRAEAASGFPIYKLPLQWCVCQEDVGIGNEIMLHIGHGRVQEFYGLKYRPTKLDPATYEVD